ncbi:MAG: hypothetical protein P8165_18155 [Deltaproteobacteria bacterium]
MNRIENREKVLSIFHNGVQPQRIRDHPMPKKPPHETPKPRVKALERALADATRESNKDACDERRIIKALSTADRDMPIPFDNREIQ